MDKVVKNILFVQASAEQFLPTDEPDESPPYTSFHQLLQDEGYHLNYTTDYLTPEHLDNIDVLVIGVPEYTKNAVVVEDVQRFVASGGALLLVTNAATMLNPPESLNEMVAIAGLKFQEYLNYQHKSLEAFWPHPITGNINQVEISDIASLSLLNDAYPAGFIKDTKEPIIACSDVSRGRVAAIGCVDWLKNKYFSEKDNRQLAINIFRWLTGNNPVEIKSLSIPKKVEWGQSATVVLQFRNNYKDARLSLKWILDSDKDALINQPVREKHALLPDKTVSIQWQVRPQKLGEQELRLILEMEEQSPVYFDQMPSMYCEAPGYFTLQMKDKVGNLKTTFQTGESFTVEGMFHWTAVTPLPHQKLQLKLEGGLIESSYEPGHGIDRWHLQAIKPGEHRITLGFIDGDQSLSTLVKISSSPLFQLDEIYAAYVCPLDAEIAERLRQVDQILSHENVRNQPFEILPTDEFVKRLYAGETAVRVSGMLAAARREQWFNPSLLDIVLEYFVPTYLPNRGSFIPYDPDLASHLAKLHITDRRFLEYNLLCSHESNDIQLKQNIAAYLLHEKYGHGFFYAQTRLGKQIAILERHSPDPELLELIKDSAIIVNEGFATWMELNFLGKLDREIRPSITARRVLLLEEGSGLFSRELRDGFFKKFPPRYDSRYREGFEYLDYISRNFSLHCSIRVFLIATNIDLGITEEDGNLMYNEKLIRERLLETEKSDWRSHFRLGEMAELLKNEKHSQNLVHVQNCPGDCQHNKCPIEIFIANQLNWGNK